MKTLYVSDLDGTLLRSNETTSEYTNETINRLADEAYAVENAVDELKEAASAVIGSNNDDGVAKWLEAHLDDIIISDEMRFEKH